MKPEVLRFLLPVTVLFFFSFIASGAPFYLEDFESSTGPEWSSGSVVTTPVGGRKFLGYFGPEQLAFTLGGLPAHTSITFTFDLFVIDTWDGNDTTYGPDIFEVALSGGDTLLRTTFSNVPGQPQSFPGAYPAGSFPALTGAAETGTLGYYLDSVYTISLTVPHSSANLNLLLSGSGLEGNRNELWGLDNVQVTLDIPEPATVILIGSALGILLLALRRRCGACS